MEGNTDLKPPPDLLNSKRYSHRLIITYNVLITILLIVAFNQHVKLSKNKEDIFHTLTSVLNIRICSKSETNNTDKFLCKASHCNPPSSLSNIYLNSYVYLDNDILYEAHQKSSGDNTKNLTSKILSAISNSSFITDRNDIKITYRERAEFSPSAVCVKLAFNPYTSVKSIKNQCQNSSKCFRDHHLGFVLVTSVLPTPDLEDPETISCHTAVPINRIRIADPRAASVRNKYIFIETRFENKHQKIWSRTNIPFLNTLTGLNNTIYEKIPSLDHEARSYTGKNYKYCSKKPKYQPRHTACFACQLLIMIKTTCIDILYYTQVIHIYDPPYTLWLL